LMIAYYIVVAVCPYGKSHRLRVAPAIDWGIGR
jgi:hypothetical protein